MTKRPIVRLRPSDEWVTIGGLRCRVWIGRGPEGEPIALYTPFFSYGDEEFRGRYPDLFVDAPEIATSDKDEIRAALKRAAETITKEVTQNLVSKVGEWVATTVPMPGTANGEEAPPT